MKSNTKSIWIGFIAVLISCSVMRADPPLPGAIFTTDSTCGGVDLNIYAHKGDVYLDGGPSHPGAASLPDGSYYVQVTDPSGACVLGTSVGTGTPMPFVVSGNGTNIPCIQLCAVLTNGPAECALNGVDPNCGYNDTTNPGGEYKVWVSTESTFTNSSTKTDNFKVNAEQATNTGAFSVHKFYDRNVNGIHDAGEPEINGWQFELFAADNLLLVRETPACLTVAAGPAAAPFTYTVVESDSASASPGTSWVHTTSTHISVNVVTGDTCETNQTWMGNVCLGAGGGLTLGFWSNKNGQNLESTADFTMLTGLCLRTAAGGAQDFTGSLTANRTALNAFLLGATATNMANMLSAQLTAMELNVAHHFVSGTALVYAPCLLDPSFPPTPGLNSLGFISIADLMAAANTELCAHGSTLSGSPFRAYQECLKTTLDNANNNQNFSQATPCTSSFTPLP